MGDVKVLDASFLKVIQEIEKSYKDLSKPIRIRVEKWLEKLVSTGSNVMWKRQRNLYAALLLDMVAKKRLTEPFNLLPCDGPLPQFPAYVRTSHGRELLGPHETSFWRGLYNQMQDVSEVTRASDAGIRLSANNPAITGSDNYRYHHEINNMRLLIKEQSTRIKLLEQQLHDERMKHELEIQRTIISHRIELGKAMKQSETLDRLKYSPPTSPRRDGASSIIGGAKSSHSPELSSSSTQQRLMKHRYSASSVNASNQSLVGSFPVFAEHERNDSSRSNVAEGNTSSWIASAPTAAAAASHHQKWDGSYHNHEEQSFARPQADIIPTRVRSSAASLSDISQMNHTDHNKANHNDNQQETSDEEFLSYVDRFQGEIYKVVVDESVDDGAAAAHNESRQSADSLQFS